MTLRATAPPCRAGSAPLATLGEAHRRLADAFGAAGLETPALDARLLVAGVLGIAPAAVLVEPERPLSPADAARLETALARRLANEPVSRILGRRSFHGLELEIGPDTLDPRPDTETLVDAVLELHRGGLIPGGARPRIADLGTGSGAIAIALLSAIPGATAVATDIAPAAIAIAQANAERHGVAGRLASIATNWMDGLGGPFDVIVSNPPYVRRGDIAALAPEVADYDPRRALDGGDDGLDAYRRIVPAASQALIGGGWLVLEIGVGQDAAVAALAASVPGYRGDHRRWADLSGKTRCLAFQHC